MARAGQTARMEATFQEVPLSDLGDGDDLPPRARWRLSRGPLVHHDVWAARDLPGLGRVVSLSRHSLKVWDRGTGALLRAFRPGPALARLRPKWGCAATPTIAGS